MSDKTNLLENYINFKQIKSFFLHIRGLRVRWHISALQLKDNIQHYYANMQLIYVDMQNNNVDATYVD